MRISLPKKYSYKDSADVYNEILYVHQLDSFRSLMFDLTYAINGPHLTCKYCGKKLERKNATIDHIYPENLGGPYIPENLCVSCKLCNNLKKDILLDDFSYYASLSKKEQLAFEKNYRDITIKELKCNAPVIPKNWYLEIELDEISIMKDSRKGTKYYEKLRKFYTDFHRIRTPIIVDKNLTILDGYSCAILARENGLKKVPTIILENVVLEC